MRRRVQTTCREGNAHVDVARVHRSTGTRRVAVSAMEDNRRVRVISRIVHSQWLKDVFLYKVLVTLAANFFNQISKQHVSGIAVVPLFSRLEIQVLITESGHQ